MISICSGLFSVGLIIVWILLLHSTISYQESNEVFQSSSLHLRESSQQQDRKLNIRKKAVNPPNINDIRANISLYFTTIHQRLGALAGPKVEAIDVWNEFFDVTNSLLIKWDDENRNNYFIPRNDDSIFVSLGTYRDPFCPMTLKSLYSQAKNPQKIFVGLFQQNCFERVCRTGVLKDGVIEDTSTDIDCYVSFCESTEGKLSHACVNGNIQLFNVNESESLGPYMARYFGAKFYRGEQYYLQIDSHSEFVTNWDFKLIQMMLKAPAKNPIISTYPPDSSMDWRDTPGFRICDSEFATSQIEWQIIRLSPSRSYERTSRSEPAYAPYIAAGFFFSKAQFLHEVPFDPLLPWIFMGEEISMSARLWTAGYDIFAPTTNVLNHYYVRRHYPKFWESVNRFFLFHCFFFFFHSLLSFSSFASLLLLFHHRYFKKPIHNEITELVIKRVKHMLTYAESTYQSTNPPSLLHR